MHVFVQLLKPLVGLESLKLPRTSLSPEVCDVISDSVSNLTRPLL